MPTPLDWYVKDMLLPLDKSHGSWAAVADCVTVNPVLPCLQADYSNRVSH